MRGSVSGQGWRFGRARGQRSVQGKCWVLTGRFVRKTKGQEAGVNQKRSQTPTREMVLSWRLSSRGLQMSENKHLLDFDASPVMGTQQLKPWKLFFVLFCFWCGPLQDRSGRALPLIAIPPGSTKSQMKRQRGSFQSHVTKSLVKAQERRSAMALELEAGLQSRLAQEAVIPFPVCVTRGDDGTTEVWRKTTLLFSLMFGHVLSPKDVRIHCYWVFLWADEKGRRSHRNHIGTNVTSDPGRAGGVETSMMGLLVSGLVCARLKQRKTEEFPKQPCCQWARACWRGDQIPILANCIVGFCCSLAFKVMLEGWGFLPWLHLRLRLLCPSTPHQLPCPQCR